MSTSIGSRAFARVVVVASMSAGACSYGGVAPATDGNDGAGGRQRARRGAEDGRGDAGGGAGGGGSGDGSGGAGLAGGRRAGPAIHTRTSSPAVDRARLETILKDMTGYNVVQIGGQAVRIAERYTPASKALWRAYWTAYMTALGATVRETTFPVNDQVGETVGHNVEAVFPGRSADSIVAVVHYDSTGAPRQGGAKPPPSTTT